MNYSSIGKILRRSRKRLGLSQFDVADAMGCSRAQVDNIEVARQRAPLYRLEDFAKAVGMRLSVQIMPRNEKLNNVRTSSEMVDMIKTLGELDELDRELVLKLVTLMPQLPQGIRGTLRGIVALWSERYRSSESVVSQTA